ncbi:hypothetical protein M758_UG099400 [Ceratodon purpureus]|nr:hypothetical protein M758_UG099400 [Ceratodon purpureus]
MMQVPEEIEDPEGYCMLKIEKIEKIEAIHGSLRQSVQMGHMKPDRAEALKNKFEDLREALRKKFATERKLAAERSELEFEKQQQEVKLETYRKEAKRDEETIAIIREDAEEADAEAIMAVDRWKKALVETEELKTMRINYKQKIVEIEHEFFVGLEPVVARLKVGESLLSASFTSTSI